MTYSSRCEWDFITRTFFMEVTHARSPHCEELILKLIQGYLEGEKKPNPKPTTPNTQALKLYNK